MVAPHRSAATGVRAAGPQGWRWGQVPCREGPRLLPRALMKAGAAFLAAQQHHARLPERISITVTAIRYQPGEH